ncbi:MAG: insulinase family protein [Bacteroidales bacterium]
MQHFQQFHHVRRRVGFFPLLVLVFTIISCNTEKNKIETATDNNGYTYEFVKNDPAKARIYTLDNGLKVYLSYNGDEPRVSTLIGVKAGSTSDPAETTGLAHYFEHMMFKGTDEIGTLDWENEKIALDRITELFEEHRAETDPEIKKAIYHEIDSMSQIAASYVVPNEYDKMVSSLGAKRTNAGTSYESTVYMNDIPSNELEKWLKLERERFGDMVLRLFHTELETVYEEFNMYQDMDRSRASNALFEGLFPTHPYGRDVIGEPEHLKNPSLVNIYKFAETWYRPNNMAIALAGDMDLDATIAMIDKYFGDLEPNPQLPEIVQPVEKPITEPVVKEVVGPDAESMSLAFRFDGGNTDIDHHVSLIDMLLSNSQAGLIDINLNQKQKVLKAGSYSYFMRDYGMHNFYGQPREGQTLEEVKDLLLEQIELIKKGEFDDWLLEAVVNDMRLSEIRRDEYNFARVYGYINSFVMGWPYNYRIGYIDEMEKITKDQLVTFANENYKDNYVVVYKRTGENKDLYKVEKPEITPIDINRDDQSEFFTQFMAEEADNLSPVFVDFEKRSVHKTLKPVLRSVTFTTKPTNFSICSTSLIWGKITTSNYPSRSSTSLISEQINILLKSCKKNFSSTAFLWMFMLATTAVMFTLPELKNHLRKGLNCSNTYWLMSNPTSKPMMIMWRVSLKNGPTIN